MKDYVRPMMESEDFAANEYIAACGEVPTSYKFVCDKESEYHGGIIFGHYSSLYYYDTLDRFYFNLGSLLVFSCIMILVSYISLRRQKYDSI